MPKWEAVLNASIVRNGIMTNIIVLKKSEQKILLFTLVIGFVQILKKRILVMQMILALWLRLNSVTSTKAMAVVG